MDKAEQVNAYTVLKAEQEKWNEWATSELLNTVFVNESIEVGDVDLDFDDTSHTVTVNIRWQASELPEEATEEQTAYEYFYKAGNYHDEWDQVSATVRAIMAQTVVDNSDLDLEGRDLTPLLSYSDDELPMTEENLNASHYSYTLNGVSNIFDL